MPNIKFTPSSNNFLLIAYKLKVSRNFSHGCHIVVLYFEKKKLKKCNMF
jgi:hypothetical protein